MIEVERANSNMGREGAIQSVRDYFYKGEIGKQIVAFCQENGGLLTENDMAEFQVEIEKPTKGNYKGIDVLTCGPWCQGPVVIETLHILESFNLRDMGHNSADYIHTVIEALKLSVNLIFSLDQNLLEIVFLSLRVTLTALAFSCVFCTHNNVITIIIKYYGFLALKGGVVE